MPADSPLNVRNCKNRMVIDAAPMPSRTGRLGAAWPRQARNRRTAMRAATNRGRPRRERRDVRREGEAEARADGAQLVKRSLALGDAWRPGALHGPPGRACSASARQAPDPMRGTAAGCDVDARQAQAVGTRGARLAREHPTAQLRQAGLGLHTLERRPFQPFRLRTEIGVDAHRRLAAACQHFPGHVLEQHPRRVSAQAGELLLAQHLARERVGRCPSRQAAGGFHRAAARRIR